MGAGFHGGFGNTDGTKSNETNKLIKELESNYGSSAKLDFHWESKKRSDHEGIDS